MRTLYGVIATIYTVVQLKCILYVVKLVTGSFEQFKSGLMKIINPGEDQPDPIVNYFIEH